MLLQMCLNESNCLSSDIADQGVIFGNTSGAAIIFLWPLCVFAWIDYK